MFSKQFDTWIIAYCPDTDSFFATVQRFFWWEDIEQEFESEDAAITHFRENTMKYITARNKFDEEIKGLPNFDYIYFENTKERFNKRTGLIDVNYSRISNVNQFINKIKNLHDKKSQEIYIISEIDGKGTHIGKILDIGLDADENIVINTDIESVSETK